ncbi:hypothetical protein IW261DRAFT_1016409 [Armillaria novae-zelandiae]|uniref:Uncharacterized protein n=1 Tax=Armillaria novae-zelandiae TaxID=153914 RepID=A0AA39NN71_9AGAR|nr:hypothetical protein IW261DRAFT_1016409 [Armillaria novae-zelandiae]
MHIPIPISLLSSLGLAGRLFKAALSFSHPPPTPFTVWSTRFLSRCLVPGCSRLGPALCLGFLQVGDGLVTARLVQLLVSLLFPNINPNSCSHRPSSFSNPRNTPGQIPRVFGGSSSEIPDVHASQSDKSCLIYLSSPFHEMNLGLLPFNV